MGHSGGGIALAAAAVALLTYGGWMGSGMGPGSSEDDSTTRAESTPSQQDPTGQAAQELNRLKVKGPTPMTDYDREGLFGPDYNDDVDVPLGRNGCDTRNDVLALRLDQVKIKPGTNDCVVTSGRLDDPYSGKSIDYKAGDGSDIHLEHVVSLGDAWRTGARHLSQQERTNLANDPLNLLMAKGSLNTAKGDANIATWQPPNKSFRCDYAARQIAVKSKYDLWVVPAEKRTLTQVLSSCPDQQLPEEATS